MISNEPRQSAQSDAPLPSLEAATNRVVTIAGITELTEQDETVREPRWDDLPCTD